MTDYETKLNMNYLSKIINFSSTINPLLNNIYKEEYYEKLKEQNKKMISLRCKNKICYQIFMNSDDYEIINSQKEKRRKKQDNKYKMNIKCNKCKYVSSFDLN